MRLKAVVRGAGRQARLGTVLSAALTAAYSGTDKVSHGYLPHYDRHPGGRYRRLVVIEIGVGGTGRTNRRSCVCGVTTSPLDHRGSRHTPEDVDARPPCPLRACDESKAEDLQRVLAIGPPDVIIDDGSHIGEHVCTTFETLFPRMATGGVYVIEDLHTSYWPSYGGEPRPAGTHSGRTAA